MNNINPFRVKDPDSAYTGIRPFRFCLFLRVRVRNNGCKSKYFSYNNFFVSRLLILSPRSSIGGARHS